jgi:hypothetical protein
MDFEDIFRHATALLFRNWARVETFLRVAELGMPHAQMAFREHTDNLLSEPEELSDKSVIEYLKQVGSAGYADLQVNDAQSAVDAAALIFTHSVLDDAAMKCCRLIALAKPQKWEYWIDDKQVALAEVKEHGYDSLFHKTLERRLSKLEHESLLAKADMILRLCKPSDGFSCFVNDYVYDRSRLSLLDEQRHQIVHRGSWAATFRRDDNDLEYLFNTGIYFFDLVSVECRPQDTRNMTKDQRQ